MARAAKAAVDRFAEFNAQFEKDFGEGTLHTGSEITPYDVISTGSLAFDNALGVGGYVIGRQHEMWGNPGGGKTTLSLLTTVQALKKDPDRNVAWIDAEHTFDRKWAIAHGVDLDRVTIHPPLSSEDVADAMKRFLASGLFSMVIVDSLGALISRAEQEKMAEEAVVAKQASIITRMSKIATIHADSSHVAVLYLNQVRANIGGYGATETTGGGWNLKHATTSKTKVSLAGGSGETFVETIDGQKITVGKEIRIRVERNKVAPEGKVAQVVLFNQPSKFGPVGLDVVDDVVSTALKTGIINQGGAWYDIPGVEQRFNGKDRVLAFVKEHPEIGDQLRHDVLTRVAGEVYEKEEVDDE